MPDSHGKDDQLSVASPPSDVRRRKAELRARILATRRARRADDATAALQEALLSALPQLVGGQWRSHLAPRRPGSAAGGVRTIVAAYAPFATEPGGRDLPAVLAAALGPTGQVLLPVVCDDRDLDWIAYGGPDTPASPPLGRAAITRASLVVVPAVAVDHRGVRLGRGGGSYDRALARVSADVPVVALLHDDELLAEDLPAEPHDRPVSAVMTPTAGLVRLPAIGWTVADDRVHH